VRVPLRRSADPSDAGVVVLAGGTGGAKLARGMLDVVGGERLTVIANTGDDIEIYGAHVSPDPDLVSFWLADRIDERGWGLRDDSFVVMDALRELGVDVWFHLGDRDLAWCIERRRLIETGMSATAAMAQLTSSLGIGAQVLPMADQPVRTWIRGAADWIPFQEFMIRLGARGPVAAVEYRGAPQAVVSAEILDALSRARAIVIGPSNPVISIGPILAVPGMRAALAQAPAPVVAVSPIVAGQVLKGPTAAFMASAGLPVSAQGVADHYGDVLDGIVADEPVDGLEVLHADTRMDDAASRRRTALLALEFADALTAPAHEAM
jgi:LPPG:FO 2-phospho-L-lactate transferase